MMEMRKLQCCTTFNRRETAAQLKNETILRNLYFNEEENVMNVVVFYLTDHPIAGQLQNLNREGERRCINI